MKLTAHPFAAQQLFLRRDAIVSRGILYGSVIIALVLVMLCGTVLYQSRLDALERATDASRNVAIIAERDIERNFELYDLSLRAVVEGMSQPDVMALSPRLRDAVLFDRAATAKYLGSMLVLDAQGNIIMDAASENPRPGNFADRNYFTVQRDNPDVGLYVSDPYHSRLRNGALTVALSRRLSNADGSFAGIVMIAVNVEYFHNLFAGLQMGPHGSIALISRGGTMLMRQPYDEKVIGRSIRGASTYEQFIQAQEGTFTDKSSIDGRRRLYVFKNFTTLPLIIMVAEAEDDIYSAWRKRALMTGSLTLASGIGVVCLSLLLGAQLRRRLQAESELQVLARTDGLTGLINRRTLTETLQAEWRRAERSGNSLSLLFVDIDWFKSYNDTYGHQAGDDVLSRVALCLRGHLHRPADAAARYGGEEFVVVLPETDPDYAWNIAERLRQAVHELGIDHSISPYGGVTVSIGMSSWQPGEEGDIDMLIKVADSNLYRAKAAGRNRVFPSLDHSRAKSALSRAHA